MPNDTDTQTAAAPTTAAQIDAWFLASFSNGPIAQNTETYNQAFTAKEKLKALLAPKS